MPRKAAAKPKKAQSKSAAKPKPAPKKAKKKEKFVVLADGSLAKPLPPGRRRRSRGKSQPRAMIERWLDRMGVDHSEANGLVDTLRVHVLKRLLESAGWVVDLEKDDLTRLVLWRGSRMVIISGDIGSALERAAADDDGDLALMARIEKGVDAMGTAVARTRVNVDGISIEGSTVLQLVGGRYGL